MVELPTWNPFWLGCSKGSACGWIRLSKFQFQFVYYYCSQWISIPFQVDINGHITFSDIRFGSDFSPSPLESIRVPRAAPLWIDLNAQTNGNVYYRVLDSTRDDDQTTLASISQQSSAAETISSISFDVKWALLVTWDHVAYFRIPTAVSHWIAFLHIFIFFVLVNCMWSHP